MEKIETFNYPRTIGIVGGGQLGRMLIYCSQKLDYRYVVLDPDPEAPARRLSDHFIQGSLYDPSALQKLLELSDLVTYEIEHIQTDTLLDAEERGKVLHPSPQILKVIQDKGVQKTVFFNAGVPVPRFFLFDGKPEEPSHTSPSIPAESTLSENLSQQAKKHGLSYPLVQKTRTGGYDGRGVKILKNPQETPFSGPSIVEEYVPFQKELALIAARDRKGSVALYPVVEMIFNADHNICDTVLAPARVPMEVVSEARIVAQKAVEALNGVGVFGVELFLTQDNQVLLNEVAPRPHNSGHYTIEACYTSQFEQHVRAITGLPLGAVDLHCPAIMLNLLGEPGCVGKPFIDGLSSALEVQGASIHLYGKKEVRPFRKMGHVTILGASLEEVFQKAERMRGILKVRSV